MSRVRIGVAGCGDIARRRYLPGIKSLDTAELVAVCDPISERASHRAREFNVPKTYHNVDKMLEDQDIDLVINLTSIQSHFGVSLRALQNGKHVYTEKTMTVTVEEATHLIEEARSQGLKLSSAPNQVLDPVHQHIKQLLGQGVVGKISFVRTHASHAGPEYNLSRTTYPEWFYAQGAGALRDIGVYALHTITGLLGPAKRVCCMSGIAWPVRMIRTGPDKGKGIRVEEDENTLLLLDFGDSIFAFIDGTNCARASRSPRMEIFGEDGTISIGVPGSDAPIDVFHDNYRMGMELRGWMTVQPPTSVQWAGLVGGVAHVVDCILYDREPLNSAEHARHCIEIIEKSFMAAGEGRTLDIETTF